MNADYLAAKELAAKEREIATKERDIAEKERSNRAQEAERYRAAVAEIASKDAERLSKYGWDAAKVGVVNPNTGEIDRSGTAQGYFNEVGIGRYIRDTLRDILIKGYPQTKVTL